MQVNRCFSDILLYNNTIDFSSYNLLRPNFEKWVNDLCIDRQQTYITPYQLIECISRIPEVRVINNLILPNWIINTSYDVDYVITGLYKNPKFWAVYHSYNWINACCISVYQHKYLYGLLFTTIELLNHCKWLILSVPSFMTLTEFWDWLLKCPELNDGTRARIIFFTPKQAKTYRTAASGGSIPFDIAKQQNQFYTNEYNLKVFNTIGNGVTQPGKYNNIPRCVILKSIRVTDSRNMNTPADKFIAKQKTPDETLDEAATGTDILASHQFATAVQCSLATQPIIRPDQLGLEINENAATPEPLIIQEIDKLRTELIKYNLAFPDALQLETGGLLEKINNIREILGIHKSINC
jgi:hypothetical protein